LIVDDDDLIRSAMSEVLQYQNFKVTTAANVPDALKLISSNVFDVLLSDLHMPDAGDGLTVVSAMRHANPKAVTMLLSAFPEMDAASQAILMQADQILLKPIGVMALVKAIRERLTLGPPAARVIESVATILERTTEVTIQDWFTYVEKDKQVMAVPMTYQQRTGYLYDVLRDLVIRLRSSIPIGAKELVSPSASEHGLDRRQHGYSAAMLVEESRMLQVSVFHTLEQNLAQIDFSTLLADVMTIADEIDSQLSQAIASYVAESLSNVLPN
jgi:YesN/AraC family two-component response regulator